MGALEILFIIIIIIIIIIIVTIREKARTHLYHVMRWTSAGDKTAEVLIIYIYIYKALICRCERYTGVANR